MRIHFRYRNILLLGAIFIVLITTLVYIGNTARQRFDMIIETLIEDRNAVGPEQAVRNVQTLLAETELAVKVFVLTNDEEPWLHFYDLNFQMMEQFAQFHANKDSYSPEVKMAIDSLESVTIRRIRIFEDLVETRDEFRVKKAMEKVEKALEEATSEIQQIYADTVNSDLGKKRALRRLFTREKQKDIYESRKKRIPDSIVKEFEVNLKQLSKSESQKETDLRQRSLEITANGEVVRQQVDSIANVVIGLRLKKNLAKQQEIEDLALASSKTVTYTVIAAIAFILAFAYFVLLQIRSTNKFMRASKRASDRALELARSKENFITNVSHELRTPLNAIIGFSELNEKEKSASKKTEYNRIVKESGQHLKSLINDLLDWSKIESGQFTFDKKPFDPQVVLSEVREIVYSQHNSPKVRFALRSNIKNTRLIGDAVRLKQTLINLLNNAFKFTDEGEVKLTMEEVAIGEKQSLLRVHITDTGIGISEEDLPKIFKDFEQVDSERNRKYEGSGLGLAITKRIIEQQGGNIEVESSLGKGSTFIIEIPYDIGSHSQKTYTTTPELNLDAIKLNILIVDDSEFNRKLLISLLDKPKIKVWQADSGEKALEILKETSIDIGLFDIKMPGMDGIELAKRVLEAYGDNGPLLIALTAANTPEMEASCQEVGYKTVLAKPLEHSQLFNIISKYFGSIGEEIPITETGEVEPGTEASVKFDPAQLNRIFEDDLEFRNEMLSVFLQSMKKELRLLASAVENKDFQAIDDITHKTLPSCRHIGAESLVASLEILRKNAKEQAEVEVLKANLNKFQVQFKSVQKIIKGIIA